MIPDVGGKSCEMLPTNIETARNEMMDIAFDPDMTYRFYVVFLVGDDDDVEEQGPERVIVKSFTIAVTADDFERLVFLDDYTEGAWDGFWRKTRWKFGQMGLCTNPSEGLFGFDTNEIDEPLQQDRLMRTWRWFLRRHGYTTGPIETMNLTLEEYDASDDNPFTIGNPDT